MARPTITVRRLTEQDRRAATRVCEVAIPAERDARAIAAFAMRDGLAESRELAGAIVVARRLTDGTPVLEICDPSPDLLVRLPVKCRTDADLDDAAIDRALAAFFATSSPAVRTQRQRDSMRDAIIAALRDQGPDGQSPLAAAERAVANAIDRRAALAAVVRGGRSGVVPADMAHAAERELAQLDDARLNGGR